jgi:SNF2 family DNA or RNA helicase
VPHACDIILFTLTIFLADPTSDPTITMEPSSYNYHEHDTDVVQDDIADNVPGFAFDSSEDILADSVEGILKDCEQIGISLQHTISLWQLDTGNEKEELDVLKCTVEGVLGIRSFASDKAAISDQFIITQPPSLMKGTILQDFQLVGIKWLDLLYRRNISCILADEMGMTILFYLCNRLIVVVC